jgi:hypothetical protein
MVPAGGGIADMIVTMKKDGIWKCRLKIE